MFNLAAPGALQQMFDFMEQIGPRFEAGGFDVEGVFHKRWADGDYGMYLKYRGEPVLYLGLWSELWRDRGHSLCIGVHQGRWSPAVMARFQRRFPHCEPYPPRDEYPFLVKGVDPVMLMGDAVSNVSRWLLQGYLVGLRDQR